LFLIVWTCTFVSSQSCRNQSHYLQLHSMEACEVDMVWHCQAGENGAPSWGTGCWSTVHKGLQGVSWL
jgi:hypothetical protein